MAADRPHVLVTRVFPGQGVQLLRDAGLDVQQWQEDRPIPRDLLLQQVAEADGLLSMLTERVDAELLQAAPRLKVVANMAVGYDNVDVPACTRHGVVACNTPGVLTETTADLTFALVLAASRRIVEAAQLVKDGRWSTWSPSLLLGADVHHKTLGVLGMGRIGWEVAKRGLGFDMRVLYHNRRSQPEYEARAPGRVQHVDFDTLLRESDVLCINVALTPETRRMIGREQLARMKPTALLVNAARGPIVDPLALYEACRDGVIAGAALDVTDPEPIPMDDPLLTLPNVTIVPHIGSSTAETRAAMGDLAARNVAAVLTGQLPPGPINPEVLERR